MMSHHGLHGARLAVRNGAKSASLKTHVRLRLQSLSNRFLHSPASIVKSFIPGHPRILIFASTWEHTRRGQVVSLMNPSLQVRQHVGHSHSHHHHDNTYLTSSNKKDAGVRITRIGLYVNVLMAVGKGVGGYCFHSQALIADAFHALTDLVSDFMTLGTVSWSLKSPSSRFPSGYGKIESLGSLGVSGLLLVGGVLMGLNACDVLYHEFFMHAAGAVGHSHGGIFGHSHSHGAGEFGPNINAAWLAAGSILVKEYLYRASKTSSRSTYSVRHMLTLNSAAMKIAKERKSSILASNAVHHRIDSLTSVVALVAIGGSHLFTGTTWLDPVGGLIVSIMVIKAGWTNTGAALLELADVGVDEEIKESVREAAVHAISQDAVTSADGDISSASVRNVQGVKAGQNFLIDLELVVPDNWTMQKARRAEDIVRMKIGSTVRGVRRVKVRFVPEAKSAPEFADEFMGAHNAIAKDVPEFQPGKTAPHTHDHDIHSPPDNAKKQQ